MKIRSNYVSNSSSSSHIVNKDLSSLGIACLKLTLEQKKLLNGSKLNDTVINLPNLEYTDYYLTQFIYDCPNEVYEELKKAEIISYIGGEMSEEPYEDSLVNSYHIGDKLVYLLKEHDTERQVKFNTFIKEFKATKGNIRVFVKYTKDGVILTYGE